MYKYVFLSFSKHDNIKKKYKYVLDRQNIGQDKTVISERKQKKRGKDVLKLMPRRGENIYKRKDGRWEGRYLIEKKLDGKRKYGSVYGITYKEVKEKLINIKLYHVKRNKPKNELFKLIVWEWLSSSQACIKESTYIKYSNLIINHIFPFLGEYSIYNLNESVLQQFSSYLLREGRIDGTGGLSPKMVKEILRIVKSVLKSYQREHPNVLIQPYLSYPKEQRKEIRIFSKEEQLILEDYLLSDITLTKLGIWLSLYTGIRLGELCALTWNDIDLENGILHIYKTMQRLQIQVKNKGEADNKMTTSKTKVIITDPKTYQSKRNIPLPSFVCEVLKNYASSEKKGFFLTGKIEHYVEPRTLQNRFKAILKRSGLPPVNYHVIRHSFASRCVELGFEIKSLSEILGHSRTSITLERYVHCSYDLKLNNMNKLKSLYSKRIVL